MNSAPRNVFVSLLIAASFGCMAQPNEAIKSTFLRFRLVVANKDWPALELMMDSIRGIEQKEYIAQFKSYLSKLPDVLPREELAKITLVGSSGNRMVAKISIDMYYHNPLANPEDGRYEETIYAISTNSGKSWLIDPANCTTEEDVASFLRNSNVPASPS